ncbi:MAG: hypothetical protein AB8C84_05670 [Oligoflexales bacterium]
MNITFPIQEPESILKTLRATLDGDSFTKALSIQRQNNEMIVQIKKMGSSTFTFQEEISHDTIIWRLKKEKIALAHRPLKEKMIQQLSTIIKKMGGQIT